MKTREGFLVLIMIGLGLFIFSSCFACEGVIINEVQINGADNAQEDFIELYNSTGTNVNLKGCRLVKRTKTGASDTLIKSWTEDAIVTAGGYHLWANNANSFSERIKAGAATSQTIASDNGIALRKGKNDEGVIIDSVGWGECANVFIEGSVFPENPDEGKSIERKNFIDSNNNSSDFAINNLPSPQNTKIPEQLSEDACGNGIIEVSEQCDDNNTVNGDGCNSICLIEINVNINEEVSDIESLVEEDDSVEWGDVVINEFVANPSDGETEFIELFNKFGKEINLDDWTIEDGSKAKTRLEGKIGGDNGKNFFVVNEPSGNLNNKGDFIVLKHKESIIDQVAYGEWDDGNATNNAPTASDSFSIARKSDGFNSYNNKNDFAVSSTITKGKSNIITNEEEIETGVFQTSNSIFISEILPNPKGEDTKEEFIEIYNNGGDDIDLYGWKLGDASGKKFSFKNENIKAHQFLIIKRDKSGIALNNDHDTVKLILPQKDDPAQVVSYSDAPEGQSFNNKNLTKDNLGNAQIQPEKSWFWSDILTPGKENEIKDAPLPLAVDFDSPSEIEIGTPAIFDSSDSDCGKNAKYFWEFGDGATSTLPGPEHTFFQAGILKVKLTIQSGLISAGKEKAIKIMPKSKNEFTSVVQPGNEILINEIMPNPEGDDLSGE